MDKIEYQKKPVRHSYSYYVILPFEWCKFHQVNRREKLNLIWEKNSGDLIIRPGGNENA